MKGSISLGLQGGGAHGAFTWGVLDRLLEQEQWSIEGISASSAGAMNAVALAQGMLDGGNAGARAALERFWTAVADSAPFALLSGSLDDDNLTLAPAFQAMLQWSRYLSPEALNPFDHNPLRDIIVGQFDFDRLRRDGRIKLFVAATHANSGKLRIFNNSDLSADAVMASACLPTIYRPVEIDGEPYWDGGFAANPAVFPLFYDCQADDIMLILLSPLSFASTPQSAEEIKNRVLELAFNSTFLREMRMFTHLRKMLGQRWPVLGRFERHLMRTRFHLIEAPERLAQLHPATRMAANADFFATLRDLGRAAAESWLATNARAVGRYSTAPLNELFY
jgi:NTE family protein